ncbi:hypothetical protein MP638_000350 [Amoeboaphelidium occidentale]|nr:hypothetical protein MP638_000350 [Amoeboaphelidium occidentale]
MDEGIVSSDAVHHHVIIMCLFGRKRSNKNQDTILLSCVTEYHYGYLKYIPKETINISYCFVLPLSSVLQEFPAVSVISKEEINYTSGAAQTAGTNRSVPSNLSLYNSIKSTKNNSHKKASTLLRNTGGNIIKNYVQAVLQMVSVYEHSKEGFCNVHLVGQKNIVTVLNLNSSNLLVIITELITSTNTQFDYESMLQVELDKIKNAL